MKSAKEVWSFVKAYIGKYYIAFLFGGVMWMLLDVYATKGIDASFVSACTDVSLVVFAFITLFSAKKEWAKWLKQDGYKIASELMNDKFIKTFEISNDLSNQIRNVENAAAGIINSLPKEALNIEDFSSVHKVANLSMRLRSKFEKLNESVSPLREELYKNIFPLSQEIQFTILKMRNNGVDFSKNNSGLMLNEHFTDFSSLTIQCENCYVAISQYLFAMKMTNNPFNECEDFILSKFNYGQLDKVFEIKSHVDEIKRLASVIRANLNELTVAAKNKKTIADYFDL
ncbi:hypothetical protein ACFL9S_04995 [Erwinia sp. AnSW2-5]|uniref:hypothetical protein n=1 Tax=Erwinia sp. AnSW2-5 TaxID=3367692 RepID=UPI00385B4E40